MQKQAIGTQEDGKYIKIVAIYKVQDRAMSSNAYWYA